MVECKNDHEMSNTTEARINAIQSEVTQRYVTVINLNLTIVYRNGCPILITPYRVTRVYNFLTNAHI